MAKPILVGIDPGRDDPSPPALAGALSRATGAPIVVIAAFPWGLPAGRGYSTPPAEAPTEVREALDRAAQALTGFDVTTKAAYNTSPARALHVVAEDLDAGLIVVGSTQRGPLGRIVPGSHTEQTIHGAPCPVAVAPHGYALPEGSMTRIGVAFHDTPEGHEALTGAAALARRCGAELRVYTIVEPVSWGSDIAWPIHTWPAPATERREAAEKALQAAMSELPADVRAESAVIEQGTVQALADAAQDLDLLVCGSRAHGPTRRVLLGSVSHMLVRSAPCPLIVLPRGTEASLEALLAPSEATAAR
jgi:nucleotide-binding universal stress UspA family protein